MSKAAVPDAWDDDWETQADRDAPSQPSGPTEPAKKPSSKVTKAQRRAQQAEFNRQLWEEAEAPKTFHFLETRPSATVPLKNEFKPPPILLSRKPQSQPRPPTDGIAGLTIASSKANPLALSQQDDSSDSESEKERALTLEERRAKAAKEREEKQKKYEEVRERLFGSTATASTNASSGASSPGDVTPPRSGTPNRGRGRGGKGGAANAAGREARSTSAKGAQTKQLFDPNYSAKPDSLYAQKREQSVTSAEPKPIEPIRSPRGPDGSGRGGFGFASRGAKES